MKEREESIVLIRKQRVSGILILGYLAELMLMG